MKVRRERGVIDPNAVAKLIGKKQGECNVKWSMTENNITAMRSERTQN